MASETFNDAEKTEFATIIGLYALGELTLGEAANRAEISKFRMQERLNEHGITLRLGPETMAEARAEVETARRNHE
ncbi:hypothetical protein BRD20_01600 [Halobacteriales archaeon SW_8_65_20]|nr:MAG: hypothetical protein BRC71_04655 [Halobacteriales archaeon QH_7_65_31]PSQ31213.1 MAG: hypothetical protein BRD16_03535 [Halobacteriales archaeon SW_6_65_46]PSQ53807.1 MAG: hypothetical protein BRD20_01600 [Halobacteriales archaeon SW_8_65_20]